MPQTGATRYQKFLKSEKAKTKLKAKKDLPKGTNVTKTNFKVKKIVIKEQLKKHVATEALSTRKLNINELLSRLNHFNTNSRTDALQGLKDLITGHPSVLELSLGQLIHGVTPLIMNIEKVVRKETLQVLHTILTNVQIDKIDPFYEVMSTYLRSAMTHIDNRIQEDSLLFLDILLLCAPKKLAKDFYKVIPNFLDMISKLRVDSKPGRTLTINLGSQITSVKWRVKVLHRLQDYLKIYVLHENILESNANVTDTTKMFDASKFNYYPLFNPNYVSVCHLSCFSSKRTQDTVIDEVSKFMEYIDTLMPLLFETWLEVCPNTSGEKNFETVISEDSASLLMHTLEVFALLWTIIQYLNKKNPSSNIQKIFCQKYSHQYIQHFVKPFPFVTNIRKSKQKNDNTSFESVIKDPKLVAENLEICHLFILMNPNINIRYMNNEIVAILNYIEKTFNLNSQDDINKVVIKILHTIFSKEVNYWTTLSVMDGLFKKILWAYFNKDMSRLFKQQIFSLLCKITLNDKLTHFHESEAFTMWLKHLPDIFLEGEVNVQTIGILHKFAVQSNSTFNIVINPKLVKIIQCLPTMKIVDTVNDTNSYHKMYALLHWIKDWDTSSLNLLEEQLMNNAYTYDHTTFILDTLKLRTSA